MSLLPPDINQAKHRAIWSVPLSPHPDEPQIFLRFSRSLFLGLNRADLVEEMNLMVKKKIEKPLGVPFRVAMRTYKNMPYLQSFTRSRSQNPIYHGKKFTKWQIQEAFESIVDWVYDEVRELEPKIRFSENKELF